MRAMTYSRCVRAVCFAVALIATACTEPSTGSPSSGTAVSVSPTLTPEQLRRQPEVSIPFSEQNWARGMRRYLFVAVIPNRSDVCDNYGFRSKMTMLVAYQSNCSSFTVGRRDDLFFYVAVRNITDRRGGFALHNFGLESQSGHVFPAVGVGAHPPKEFLPASDDIPPRTNVFGYVTFAADATTDIPSRLSYTDGDQTLSVVFDGEPAQAKQ